MAITFEDIRKANEGLGTIDVKGKDYVLVPQRVKAFRMLYPEGFILTDILSNDGGVVVMQAKAGYYRENGDPVVLGTGLAFEKQDSSYINKTSYIENCETSAIGRALGFLGLGIDAAICSAEELINAMNNQKEKPFERPAQKAAGQVQVTQVATVPPAAQKAQEPAKKSKETVASYMRKAIDQMYKDFGESFNFVACRKALIDGGLIPNKASAELTMEEAEKMVAAFYENFGEQKVS